MADPDAAADFKVGQRVQLRPDTARRIIGDRFGKVVKIGRVLVHVKMDESGHTIRVHPDKLQRLVLSPEAAGLRPAG